MNKIRAAIGWIWQQLQGTELKLWHLLVVSMVTAGASHFLARLDNEQAMVEKRSAELVEVSSDFENRVSDFIRSGAALETLGPTQTAQLMDNIEAQLRAINKIQPVLTDSAEAALAGEYAHVVVEIRDLLDGGLSIDEVRPFGDAAIRLTTTRDALLKAIA